VEPDYSELPLHSRKLTLFPIVAEHASLLFADLQAPDLYTFIPLDPPRSEQELKKKYSRWANRRSEDGREIWLNYVVYHPDLSAYLGTVQATLQEAGNVYLAYEIFPRYWRKGFAREACSALIAHIAQSYSVSNISALVDTRNEPSWRLLESMGFLRAATIPNADEFKGCISDEYLYELHSTNLRNVVVGAV
jgi:ribosomal-protein-alanine N-acetyltransferase